MRSTPGRPTSSSVSRHRSAPCWVDRNTRIWNYDGADMPTDLKDEAAGINPSRWSAD